MAKVERVGKVLAALKGLAPKTGPGKKASVVVGYATKYALYVHENREIWPPGMRLEGQDRPSGIATYWSPNGRPGYLLEPFHQIAPDLATIVRTAIIRGSTLPQALLLAGLRLQRESMKLVPVEYGFLKNSAFTQLEKPKS